MAHTRAEGVGRAPPGGVWVGVWISSRLYYPFGKGPDQHIIRCFENKKCENERTLVNPTPSITLPTSWSPTTPPLSPPPPQPPPDPPPPSDCVEINPNEHNKKRRRSQSRTPQKQRDKEKPPQLKKKTTTIQHTKPFNCHTINIRGLTQQK